MSHQFYEKHIFFCTNQREGGRDCCQNHGAHEMRAYAKQQLKELGVQAQGNVRVNSAGCLGRCSAGPVVVVYPEGVWYRWETQSDIDEIIEQHILNDQPVERLSLPS